MPTYEYRCKKCGHEFERFQGISEKPLKKCPKCGGRLQRVIGPGAGLILKGAGFYENDYKRKSVKSPESKEGSDSTSKKDSD
ncbi:zinc ribbon domain-containing protein [candidate division WOR-3 bacterium]|uniref:Zinc ribbon domain-containing protein n=1 Tax=candidate division WOR-3 bacterium TaxID=2052148 RepID=A0A9D5K7X7_UNCW3|nr:zinc ribbon domain-containing protein [candidate division WOR-3 bacterium]MBD3363877.1 zinc ribbon domain-containing protein [candidate division WOR-3 bacterium]